MKLVFKDIKLQVKPKGIHGIEKDNHIGISVFSCGNKEKQFMH